MKNPATGVSPRWRGRLAADPDDRRCRAVRARQRRPHFRTRRLGTDPARDAARLCGCAIGDRLGTALGAFPSARALAGVAGLACHRPRSYAIAGGRPRRRRTLPRGAPVAAWRPQAARGVCHARAGGPAARVRRREPARRHLALRRTGTAGDGLPGRQSRPEGVAGRRRRGGWPFHLAAWRTCLPPRPARRCNATSKCAACSGPASCCRAPAFRCCRSPRRSASKASSISASASSGGRSKARSPSVKQAGRATDERGELTRSRLTDFRTAASFRHRPRTGEEAFND